MLSNAATKLVLNLLHHSGAARLARPFFAGKGAILMLHRVEPASEKPSPFSPNAHLSITPEFLDGLLKDLSNHGFEFVDLNEAATRINRDNDRAPFICVTLDDGYRDNLQHAVPLFRQHHAPFTIFVAPGLVDGRATLWWEDLEHLIAAKNQLKIKLPGFPAALSIRSNSEKIDVFNMLHNFLTKKITEHEQRQWIAKICANNPIDPQAHRAQSIMNWKEIATLSRDPLGSIGAHTIHHYALGRLDAEQCRTEMMQSANEIEQKIGVRPIHIAYPYGYPAAAGARDFAIAAQCGFKTAVTTRHGVCYAGHRAHLTALPRISVNGHFQDSKYVRTLLSGATTMLQNKGRKLNVT